MIDQTQYKRWSDPLARQMTRISLIGSRLLEAIRAADVGIAPSELISDAVALGQELSGRPGEGALEVYRDLDSNLQSTRAFVDRWQNAGDSDTQRVVDVARQTEQELERLRDLVASTPPHIMAEIKRRLTAAFGTDEQRHEFRGSGTVMLVVFAGILLLRYLEVFTISWWIVWPAALCAAVVVAAVISTIVHTR